MQDPTKKAIRELLNEVVSRAERVDTAPPRPRVRTRYKTPTIVKAALMFLSVVVVAGAFLFSELSQQLDDHKGEQAWPSNDRAIVFAPPSPPEEQHPKNVQP